MNTLYTKYIMSYFKENSKFILLEDTDSQNNESNESNEFHYNGGIKIQGGAEHANKVVPFSLAYQSSPEYERQTGGQDIQVVPDELYNKLFFSVANEVNKTHRKTLKKIKN